MLSLINIQLFNYCNRSCWFCPPQSINKPSEFELMSKENLNNLYKILTIGKDLGYISENVQIQFDRYCEPMLDIDFVIQVSNRIKEIIPSCIISFQTNSFNLNLNTLIKIEQSSIDYIRVNLYDMNLVESINYIYSNFGENININKIDIDKIFVAVSNTNDIEFIVDRENNLKNNDRFKNRGSTLKLYNLEKRKCLCEIPKNMIGIDYDGSVYPCCEVHGSESLHKETILGNLNVDDISIIYNKTKNFNSFKYKACEYCNAKYENLF